MLGNAGTGIFRSRSVARRVPFSARNNRDTTAALTNSAFASLGSHLGSFAENLLRANNYEPTECFFVSIECASSSLEVTNESTFLERDSVCGTRGHRGRLRRRRQWTRLRGSGGIRRLEHELDDHHDHHDHHDHRFGRISGLLKALAQRATVGVRRKPDLSCPGGEKFNPRAPPGFGCFID